MPHKNLAVLVTAALLLAACGGGGGSSTSSPTSPSQLAYPYVPAGHYQTTGLSAPNRADARHSPIYRDDARLFVGVDQGVESAVPIVETRGDTQLRHGTVRDGAGRAAVVTYLAEAGGSASYRRTPTVRLTGAATPIDVARTIRAVQLINAALPEAAKLSVGVPLSGLSLSDNIRSDGRYYQSGDELPDTIHVEFVAASEYRRGAGSAAVAYTLGGGTSYVQFSRGAVSYGRDDEATILLAHELLHAVADFNHVSPTFATILEGTGAIHDHFQDGQRQPLSLLYPVDREALRAAFMGFGAWSDATLRLDGNGPHTNFGVALRNGYAEPWAYGPTPATDLAANRALGGSVTWTGTLLGLTLNGASVAGDAEIGVNLTTLRGRADFTSLEAWALRAAPGAAGTGTQWRDGDLGYAIAVRGNTFRETGGDGGRLTGIFTGAAHEGVAGTLERSDLTAAFGGSR